MGDLTESGVAVEEATPLATTSTPSGIEIAYYVEPKRKYEVRHTTPQMGEGKPGDYEWREVPSVTTILEVLDKPALPWWGMKVGAAGVLELFRQGEIVVVQEEYGLDLGIRGIDGTLYRANTELVVELLNASKLTTNHVKSEAGERGQSAHDALEAYAAIGTLPVPDEYPPEERPYLVALLKFLEDCGDGFEPESFEVMVGSVAHGYAGRYDLRGTFTKDTRLVASALTKKGEPRKRGVKYTTVPAGTKALLDLKTSKGVYASHLLQLEGYEGASIECGFSPTDARAVIHVTAHELYEFKRARATFEDFLAIKQSYHALKRVEEVL